MTQLGCDAPKNFQPRNWNQGSSPLFFIHAIRFTLKPPVPMAAEKVNSCHTANTCHQWQLHCNNYNTRGTWHVDWRRCSCATLCNYTIDFMSSYIARLLSINVFKDIAYPEYDLSVILLCMYSLVSTAASFVFSTLFQQSIQHQGNISTSQKLYIGSWITLVLPVLGWSFGLH